MTNDPTKRLFADIKEIITSARLIAARHFNNFIVLVNYEIGRLIIENEQAGENRAGYGSETLIKLSHKLTKEFGRGYSVDNLELRRKFYIIYKSKISESPIRKLMGKGKPGNALNTDSKGEKSESLFRIYEEKGNPFPLSWTHYIQLIKMDDNERSFYEVESINNNWSVRELLRQYNSALFERVALSKNKDEVMRLSNEGQVYERPSDILKQPYILEFLGFKEEPSFSESQLEQAIIDKIELFLLELGKGFLFEARQKRISFEGDDFYIDLVFYNRMLRCYVLIDLKIGKLTHGDIGQMQMYVNYFDRMVKLPEENCTVGIILCKQNNKTVVEFTLPEGQDQIFSSEYKLYLPDKDELKKQLELNSYN